MTAVVDPRTYYVNESEWKKNKGASPSTVFTGLNSKADLLMKSLGNFYLKKENLETLVSIIGGKSPLSLRIVDWFVVSYAKDHGVRYMHKNEKGQNVNFMVYLSYKAQLKAYSKKTFDPFCRRERIYFFIEDGERSEQIKTTVGQLNFFRWAIENGVIEYIQNHLGDVETKMYEAFHANDGKGVKKRTKCKKNSDKVHTEVSVVHPEEILGGTSSTSSKKKDLTLLATSKVSKHNVTITVKFD